MTTDQLRRDLPSIKVDGADLAPETYDHLLEMVVEDDLSQPAMFMLRFHDQTMTIMDGSTFKIGAAITLGVKNSQGTLTPLLEGEVTTIEPEFTHKQGVQLVVRGYDKAHRLYRNRKIRTFLKKKDSDMASTVASETGLSADVQATSVQHEYEVQYNQTDMEFLRNRASRVGYHVIVDSAKLKFRNAETSPPSGPTIKYGEDLLSFYPRISAIGQPNTVEVRGWDLKKKEAIVGTASSAATPSSIGDGKLGGAAAQQGFGSQATVTVTELPVGTQGEATAIATAMLNRAAGDYISSEGTALGNTAIRAGKTIKIEQVGTKFSGKYFVTASRHIYTHSEGYLTSFWTSGWNATNTVATLNGTGLAQRALMPGLVIGVITNLNDPDNLGRVKVKFGWMGDQVESDWAWVLSPGGGATRGLFLAHEINDQVLVGFEHGDIRRAFVLGGLWCTADKPPATGYHESGKIKLRAIKTKQGHTIIFGDDPQSKSITIQSGDNRTIVIQDTDKKIEIKSANHTILLDDQGRAVKITSGGTVEITGSGCTLKFTNSGIELTHGGGALKIGTAGVELSSTSKIDVKANAMATFKGAMTDVAADGVMNVKSSGILNIQGTLVKIN